MAHCQWHLFVADFARFRKSPQVTFTEDTLSEDGLIVIFNVAVVAFAFLRTRCLVGVTFCGFNSAISTGGESGST